MKRISLIFTLLAGFAMTAQAQFTLNNDKSVMTIDGTSNIHDWTENVGTMTGKMDAHFENGKLKSIETLAVQIVVGSITSGKSAMDKNTYKALKEEVHPHIKFTLKSAAVNGDKVKLVGTLQVAGITKNIAFAVNYSAGSSAFVLAGEYTMNMLDYNVEPPTALMGTISTGEEITMKFKLYFTK